MFQYFKVQYTQLRNLEDQSGAVGLWQMSSEALPLFLVDSIIIKDVNFTCNNGKSKKHSSKKSQNTEQ